MAQGNNPDRMFDKRVVQRNIRTGRATKQDYAEFLKALPDLSNQVRSPEEGGDDDGFDVREARAQARAQGAPRASAPFGEAPRPAAPPLGVPTPAPAAPPTPAPTVGPESTGMSSGTPAPQPTPPPGPGSTTSGSSTD